MSRRTLLTILVLSISLVFSNAFATSDCKITVKVVGEDGKVIESARVGVGFTEYLTWSSKEIPVVGFTDAAGAVTASANADSDLGFNVTKYGYYQSFSGYKFQQTKNGRWEPWNPEVAIVLRKKENPVPMYARDTLDSSKLMIVPVLGKEVGFDLIEYDWMPPYGKGKRTDFMLKAERAYVNDRDFDASLTITFPNAFDGIQSYREDRRYGSIFKLPRFAPESGYTPKLVVKKTMVPKKGLINNSDETNNYFFRVRSEEKDGKLARAMYGKIQGDIEMDPRGNDSVVIVMKYFLNPDYTRNMEFGRNLFKGLNVGMN